MRKMTITIEYNPELYNKPHQAISKELNWVLAQVKAGDDAGYSSYNQSEDGKEYVITEFKTEDI